MEHTVEKCFSNVEIDIRGWSLRNFEELFIEIVNRMVYENPDVIIPKRNTKIIMNTPLFEEYRTLCRKAYTWDTYTWKGIPIFEDSSLPILDCDFKPRRGIIRLIYDIPEKSIGSFYDDRLKTHEIIGIDRGHGFQKVPHIDHVIFNGPATIVFWKDGTKTVVKWDGNHLFNRRQAILYAFIRKIYGEGKPYHNILNEIEEAIK